MNHQDFVLPARDFLDAFTGRHIKGKSQSWSNDRGSTLCSSALL
jgi:hypothetical protein